MLQVKLILVAVVLLLGWGMALKARRPVRGLKSGARYLALGDSYTIGESVDPEERYPVQVRRILAAEDHVAVGDPEIIATTGWTTGDLLEAIQAAKPGGDGEVKWGGDAMRRGDSGVKMSETYDVVSLLIGVNNQYQGRSQVEYREQFEQLLQQCIRLAGNRPANVVVVSIPDYSVTPFARMGGRDTALIAAQIDSFNRINYEVARADGVCYVDVTAESRKAAVDPSLIARDGLHFSGKEYELWAKLMEPVFLNACRRSHRF